MGKYSLDVFEQYPLVKLRPAVSEKNPICYRLLELCWSELEPATGELLPPPPIGAGQVVLRLVLDQGGDIADACGFIRRMGSACRGGKNLAAVVMTSGTWSGARLGQLAQAYCQGFESTFLLAEPGTELMEVCHRQEIQTGLWLSLDRGILPLRRAVAEHNLQKIWRNAPVYLYAGRTLTAEELDAACRWHCSGMDCPAFLGAQMTLRRAMFPEGMTSGGLMPLRMWWQNLGTAPLYRKVKILLELRDGQHRFPVDIPGMMDYPGLGDSTFNTTARLPLVPCGTYRLWCGMEAGENLLPLAMDAPSEGGMYQIGSVMLDDVLRPYLRTMWENQYADGYYPLEDPAQPE